MKKIISVILSSLLITSCSLFKDEIKVEEKNKILTIEEREKIEREQFDRLLAEEDKENQEFIKKQLELERNNANALYEKTRSKMTAEEIQKEEKLLNLNKMKITPIK